MQTDMSVDAPADTLRYAKNLFRTRAAVPAPSAIKRLLAVLRMDLAPNRAAFGERSASGSQARQLLYDAGDNAVDLRITSTDEGFDIRGQILGETSENAEAEIRGEASGTAAVDAMGEFKLTGLPAGKYDLTISGPETEILIEDIILS